MPELKLENRLSTHSIYMVHDSGYDFGVKVGYIMGASAKSAWRAVPSYSPRPMHLDAVWQIPERYFTSGDSPIRAKELLEKALHRALGGPMNTRPEFSRTGQDWCLSNVTDAMGIISSAMETAPTLLAPQYSLPTNDNFRNPHPRHLDRHRLKIVLWIYRELITGRLKVQFVDDWRTPFERARRYSRNGIEELAAFTYAGPATIPGNKVVFETWTQIVSEFGFGPADTRYGWLKEGIVLADVTNRVGTVLSAVPADPTKRPEGVKAAYNTRNS